MGIIVSPLIGPLMGGWITDNYSWRWIFYINVPIGILALFMIQAFVEDPPYLAKMQRRKDRLYRLWISRHRAHGSAGGSR